jgi:hypothetical protein
MKPLSLLLSIAMAAVAVSSDFTPVLASKMNGKCCQSSDGGRSARYRYHMARRAIPHTCSSYAASCIRDTRNQPDGVRSCLVARASCMLTGVHVGPYSGIRYAGMEKR